MLKSPGTKLSKLKYDILLSSFAFIFNLRHYILVGHEENAEFALAVHRQVFHVASGGKDQQAGPRHSPPDGWLPGSVTLTLNIHPCSRPGRATPPLTACS
jgi:hypothetical protein